MSGSEQRFFLLVCFLLRITYLLFRKVIYQVPKYCFCVCVSPPPRKYGTPVGSRFARLVVVRFIFFGVHLLRFLPTPVVFFFNRKDDVT